jgi:hypothetical protein
VSDPTPETHVFVGTFRKPFHECFAEYAKERRYVPISSNAGISIYDPGGRAKVLEMWHQGHFDTPVYKTIEEALAIQAKAQPAT